MGEPGGDQVFLGKAEIFGLFGPVTHLARVMVVLDARRLEECPKLNGAVDTVVLCCSHDNS
jgi:hypothetical protein